MELSASEKQNVKQGNDNGAFEMEVGTFQIAVFLSFTFEHSIKYHWCYQSIH